MKFQNVEPVLEPKAEADVDVLKSASGHLEARFVEMSESRVHSRGSSDCLPGTESTTLVVPLPRRILSCE